MRRRPPRGSTVLRTPSLMTARARLCAACDPSLLGFTILDLMIQGGLFTSTLKVRLKFYPDDFRLYVNTAYPVHETLSLLIVYF
jgi:hypothetical protein